MQFPQEKEVTAALSSTVNLCSIQCVHARGRQDLVLSTVQQQHAQARQGILVQFHWQRHAGAEQGNGRGRTTRQRPQCPAQRLMNKAGSTIHTEQHAYVEA